MSHESKDGEHYEAGKHWCDLFSIVQDTSIGDIITQWFTDSSSDFGVFEALKSCRDISDKETQMEKKILGAINDLATLVTQLTVPDKLRYYYHDIEG